MKNDLINAITCNLKHGYKSLYQLKWVSSASSSSLGFSISVVGGVVAVACLVLAVVQDGSFDHLPLFSQRKTTAQKLLLVPGLRNLGNNCFLNVVLQSLASCSYFQPSLQKVIGECDSSDTVELGETLQLTVALESLLEELTAFGEERIVLNPRKVMFAMADYIQNFSLTSQQDAEEAFLHLLSSLREEFSDSYAANQSSLADAFTASNCRILTPKGREILNEKERWQQHFLGPFDGILSSILTCQSCSSQISLNFQFFHSLPLLPVLESFATIIAACTLEDCLKQFIVAEQVENYNCSHCWHIAAVKYLTLNGAKETEIEKLRRCDMQDSCTCRSLSYLENLPWSNNFSHTFKQLSIARCPKVLCIHLQRASINHFGELIKLQGHISFPLILNMLPFTMGKLQCQKPSLNLNYSNVQSDTRMLNCMYGQSSYSKVLAADSSQCNEQALVGESSFPESKCCSNAMYIGENLQANDEVSIACPLIPSEPLLYRLVSVVEHYGKTGGGHYTVYRSMRAEYTGENPGPSSLQWFCISDSDVQSVSEEDVLAAEASLLFYERIIQR